MGVINLRHLMQMAVYMCLYYIVMTHFYNKIDLRKSLTFK